MNFLHDAYDVEEDGGEGNIGGVFVEEVSEVVDFLVELGCSVDCLLIVKHDLISESSPACPYHEDDNY